jgi:hypothetical protein
MQSNNTAAVSDCAREGRQAFAQCGVSGINKHNYPEGSVQKVGFINGFSEAQHQAHEIALAEAVAYHSLSVREAHLDRAWAEKLFTARGL